MRKLIMATFMALLIMSPTSTLAAPPNQESDGEAYTVQAGDWLSKLAEKYYGDPLAYLTIVDATNAKAAEDSSFAAITNPDVIEVGQKIWIPAQAAPAEGSGPSATIIELADGTRCLDAGQGATLAFDGKRLNYTCGTQGEDKVGLIGDVLVQTGDLIAEKAIIGHNESGFYLKEALAVSGPAAVIELADGTRCLNAGQGATLAFDGKRLNHTCGQQGEDQVGLLGDLQPQAGWFMAEKAVIGHNESGFFVKESTMVSTTLISQQAPTASSAPASISGVVWRWEQTLMSNDDTFTPDNPNNYTVQFMEDGSVSIQADCNQMRGSYTVEGKSITITLGPTTLVACPPGSLGDQFVKNLNAAAIYFFEGDNLLIDLMVDSGTMRFSPQSAELAGTSWTATGVNNGQAAVVSLIAGTEITANFGTDGKLTGSAGCNSYTATYQIEDSNISIGPAAATRKLCSQPEDVMAQETQYLAALVTAATYQLRGDKLELRTTDGALAVTFAGSGQTGPSASSQASVSGTLTYLQRIALPPNAVAEVKLVDVSRQDAAAIVLSEQVISTPGQVPISFEVTYDPGTIDPAHTYAIQARITVDGQPRFMTTTAYLVITQGHPTTIEVILEQVN